MPKPNFAISKGFTCVVFFLLLACCSASAQTMWYVDDDAPDDPGPGDPAVSDPLEDGSAQHPFDAIQEGVSAALSGDEVVIFDGTYAGSGNRGLDFGGRAITLRSANGPDACVIDCESSGRAFWFHNNEGIDSVLDGVTILNGSAQDGAAIYCFQVSPLIVNCRMTGNNATTTGGAVVCEFGAPLLVNCVINDNSAGWFAGGVKLESSDADLINCTITGNSGGWYGGGLVATASDPLLGNCVLWGNTAPDGPQVSLDAHSTLFMMYSVLQDGPDDARVEPGSDLDWGEGNLLDAPMLTAEKRPQPGSPCIDSGSNDLVPSIISVDADGNPRFSDDPNAPDTGDPGQTGFPVVDMGAFEVLMLVGDFDGSGVVDLADFSMLSGCFAGPVLLSGDLDANGAVELADHALMSFCLGGPLTSPDAACRAADLDRDGDADLADFGVLQVGFAQQLPPLEGDCAATDLDGDRDVDATDFAAFQMVFPAGAGSLRPATAYLPEF